MRFFYPNHRKWDEESLSLLDLTLRFQELSFSRYPCLSYALEAAQKGGLYLAVLNASNEAAVELFLNDRISFLQIEEIIRKEIRKPDYQSKTVPSLEERLRVSKEVYQQILHEHGVMKS